MASTNNGNTQWYQPVAGLSNVGSYQVAGIPWATSSLDIPGSSGTPVEVSFPQVTKFVVVKNLTSDSLRVGFSANGVRNTNNYFVLTNLESFSGDFRVTKIYLLGDSAATSASVVAGLTGIPAGELVNSWSGSAGVG